MFFNTWLLDIDYHAYSKLYIFLYKTKMGCVSYALQIAIFLRFLYYVEHMFYV
jgi:hypothetical protein